VTTAAAHGGRGAAARERAITRRVAAWLAATAWLAGILAVLGTTAAMLVLHRGDADGSARLANREIDELLERGEVVEARAGVLQRRWWDYFRVTHGVLAATDHRLIYVGVPPEELFAREPEPRELVELSLPYERPVTLTRHRVFLGSRAGVTVRATGVAETFGVTATEVPRLERVLGTLAARQEVLRAVAEAERRAAEATAAAARRPTYHLVQRGEVLEVIARRYGVSVDSLIAWNALPSTRVTAGSRLVVKPGS
jgi:LysM domain